MWLGFTNHTLNSRFASKWEVVGLGNILLKASIFLLAFLVIHCELYPVANLCVSFPLLGKACLFYVKYIRHMVQICMQCSLSWIDVDYALQHVLKIVCMSSGL